MRPFFFFLVFAGVHVVTPQTHVEPHASAGLFVGVQKFTKDSSLADVAYAADDAVDLAYEVSIEQHLVPPERVVLALSGRPQKELSRTRLAELKAAHARVECAGTSDLLNLLEEQAAAVGPKGVLFVSFATHGVSDDGVQYLLAADSIAKHHNTALTDSIVCDIVSKRADRAFIVFDACREHLRRDYRPGQPDPWSKAVFLARLDEVHGQAVLSAATNGNYAYDDDKRMNGVFTGALIDALRCGAKANEEGIVTADSVATYVDDRVIEWMHENGKGDPKKAIQRRFDGHSGEMPLALCLTHTAASAPHPQH